MKATKHTIIAFIANAELAQHLETTANSLGFQADNIPHANQFGEHIPTRKFDPGESLKGQRGNMTAHIVKAQPILVIFDLGNPNVIWQKWMGVLKSSPATRRIPIVAINSEVDTTMRQEARSIGAETVVSYDSFQHNLPKLIKKFAKIPDYKAIATACTDPLHALAQKGIDLYNNHNFFDAHEELEDAWKDDKGAGRDLYRAILQIAVAFLQIERGNYNGALKMMLRVKQWLLPLPSVCRGVDIDRLRQDAENVHTTLLELGAGRLNEFDWSLCRPILVTYEQS